MFLKNKPYIYLYYFLLFIISYTLFSPLNFPFLNSDNAIHALMVKDFNLEFNFYYWGQCRLGSLFPFLANKIYIATDINPTYCMVFIHHLFQIIALAVTHSFFQRTSVRMLISFALFIPLPEYHTFLMIGHPYLAQITCILLSVYFLSKSYKLFLQNKHVLLVLFSSLAVLFSFLSVWLSELSIVFMLCALLLFTIEILNANYGNYIYKWTIIAASTSVFIALVFWLSAKKATFCAPGELEITTGLNNISTIHLGIMNLYHSFIGKESNALLYIGKMFYLFSILIVTIFSFIKVIKNRFKSTMFNGLFILILLFWGTLFSISLSKWVEINLYDSRYLSLQFIEGVFVISMFLEIIRKNISVYLSYIIPVFTIYSLFLYFNSSVPVNNKDYSFKELQPFEELGNIGIIGNYWNSYIIAFRNPNFISATPHDKDNVRNPEGVKNVFFSEKILVVKNDWLSSFPDTLTQFGNVLVKNGNPQTISRIDFCEYRLR